MKTLALLFAIFLIGEFSILQAQYPRDSTTNTFEVDCQFDPAGLIPSDSIITQGQKKLVVILVSSPDAMGHPKLGWDEVNLFEVDLELYFSEMSRGLFTLDVQVLVKDPTIINDKVSLFVLPENFDPAHPQSGFLEVLQDVDKIYDFNEADFDQNGLADHIAIVIAKFSVTTPAKLYGAVGLGIGTFISDDYAQSGNTASGMVEISPGGWAHNYSATQSSYYDRFTILQHELSHSLFEFLDIEHGGGDDFWYGTGNFDGSIGPRFGDYPMYWNPAYRKHNGWITSQVINSTQELILENLETNLTAPLYIIQSPYSNNEEFWIVFHNHNDFNDNKFLEDLPVKQLDLMKGCLIYRHRISNSTGNPFSFDNRRSATLALESASGKWEWSNTNANNPLLRKYRTLGSDNLPIPNISLGFDSLQMRGSFIWKDGNTWMGTYPDLRIGSFTDYFEMDGEKYFSVFSNPSSNLTDYYDNSYPLNISSAVALKNFRIENNIHKVDVVIGPESYIVDKSTKIKVNELKLKSDIIITNPGVEVTVVQGSNLTFENNSSIFVQNGATLIAVGVTFDFVQPDNRNAVYATNGGHLTLKNSTVINGEKGVRALYPGRVELTGNTINNEYGTVELFNIGSNRAVIYNNEITGSNPYSYGIVASGLGGSSEIVLSGNTVTSGSGAALYNFGSAQLALNEIQGMSIVGSKGFYAYNIGNLYLLRNQIHHFDLGISTAGGTVGVFGFNKIFSNLGYGMDIRSSSSIEMHDNNEWESTQFLRSAGCNECFNNGNNADYVLLNSEIHIGTNGKLALNGPSEYGYNSIYDERHITFIPNDILIYNSSPSIINNNVDAEQSYWGGNSPEGRFYPETPQFYVDFDPFRSAPFSIECPGNNGNYFVMEDLEGNVLDTLYYEESNTTITLSELDSLFAFASENRELGDFNAALEAYEYIINNYPVDPGVVAAYQQFLDVLNQINATLSDYANFSEMLSSVIHNGDTTEIDLFLERLYINTNISMGNYQVAQYYLDSIIQNSQSSLEVLDAEFEQIFLSLIVTASQQNRGGTINDIKNSSVNLLDFASDKINTNIQKNSFVRKGKNNPINTVPSEFFLESNYPNPFNPVTTIKYGVPEKSYVTLRIYDMLGRLIKVLQSGEQLAGSYTVNFDGAQYASGIYFYELRAGNYFEVRKMNLIK